LGLRGSQDVPTDTQVKAITPVIENHFSLALETGAAKRDGMMEGTL